MGDVTGCLRRPVVGMLRTLCGLGVVGVTCCATCQRPFDSDSFKGRYAAWKWLQRPDGAGLMCPTCQDRSRRGIPLVVKGGGASTAG